MEFIIDFYKSLDTLNLIIFWGIIIVIILLLIFSCILLNKNKKLKTIVEKSTKPEEELPIKKTEVEQDKNSKEIKDLDNDNIILPEIPEENNEHTNINKTIETEKNFIAEEHVMEYNKDSSKSYDNKYQEKSSEYKPTAKKEIEIPTKPYQRNVLREMALSQTSPIGITRPIKKEDRKVEMAKELQESLNANQDDIQVVREISKEEKIQKENEELKKELTKIENSSPRKTEIVSENRYRPSQNYYEKKVEKDAARIIPTTREYRQNSDESHSNELIKRYSQLQEEKNKTENTQKNSSVYEERKNIVEEPKKIEKSNINEELIASPVKELLNSVQETPKSSTKSSSEKYLEEVSRKLAEAEIPDEIERTDYELEQEENAIISYTELMEKKDSIQTIDEEEAVISIEELMNRSNKQQEQTEIEENTKLYNITEEEENDEFLKQLKQFRNDL